MCEPDRPRSSRPSLLRGPLLLAGLLAAAVLAACGQAPQEESGPKEMIPMEIRQDVKERLAKFSPTPIEADLSTLTPAQQDVLDRLIEASRMMGEAFLRQAWHENAEIRAALASDDAPLARDALRYFDISAGPWDRLDGQPFLGDRPRPEGAGYYPPDMTKEEFESWVRENPTEAGDFRSLFSVIRREGNRLVALPYSEAYRRWLEPAAASLREAAALTDNASLRRFLQLRADAFLTDDYYDSDTAWMDLDSRIEVTIGPYETYEDRLFGYKAAFEAFVTIQDPEASEKLAFYKDELPALERNLPIPDEYKNLDRGTESPIRVVDVVFAAGDTRAGVQTIAFNLPNDERVREAKGSKKVLLRNVMNAKFEKILRPIAGEVITGDQLSHVTAQAFFNETLFHELSHGLGPGKITVDGRETEVRLELKELYSALEEAKADVMGVWNILYMIDQGHFPETMRRDLFVTYLAGMFRSVRFGIKEAHGRGIALQYNYLKEKDAIRLEPETGKVSVNFSRFGRALEALVRELCVIQAKGDYDAAKAILDRYAVVPPEWQDALDRLGGIPVDIRPIYTAAGERD